jgi:hypothetical protein
MDYNNSSSFFSKPWGYNEGRMVYTNGETMTVQKYFINYNGVTQNAFCLDAALQTPYSLYRARQLDINNANYGNYDKGLLAIYQLFTSEEANYPVNDTTLDAANVAMRMLTIKYGLYNASSSSNVFYTTHNHSSSLYNTWLANSTEIFEGIKNKGIAVDLNHRYDYGKLYYCLGALACNKDKENLSSCPSIDEQTITECDKYASNFDGYNWHNDNLYPVKDYNISFKADLNKIETTYSKDGNTFEKKVPLTIVGYDDVIASRGHIEKMNPYLIITGVTCNNSKVTCKISNTENLIGSNYDGKNIPEVNVIVTGNPKDIASGSTLKATISYSYYFPLSSANFAILMGDDGRQRMAAYLLNTTFNSSLQINIEVPKICKTEVNGTSQIYKFGSQETDFETYINSCCELDATLLTADQLNKYHEKCGASDIVHIEANCGQTCTDKINNNTNVVSHSFVHQTTLDTIMSNIKTAEKSYFDKKISLDTLFAEYKKYDRYKDTTYITGSINAKSGTSEDTTDKKLSDSKKGQLLNITSNPVTTASQDYQSSNTYCMLYTSESDDIYLPGTTLATSGQFFVFDADSQPKILGTIYADMHTDYARWKQDYDAALKTERDDYDDWQTEAAKKSAADNAAKNQTLVSKGCPYDCNCKTDTKTNKIKCDTCYSDYYSYSGSTDVNKYYDVKGTNLSYSTSYNTCDGTSAIKYDATKASGSIYESAKKYREQLQLYKKACETRNNLETYWNYNLDPDVDFYYSQDYINGDDYKKIITKETMEIAKDQVKHWDHPTQQEITDKVVEVKKIDDSTSNNPIPTKTDNSVIYGGGDSAVNDQNTIDTNTDYQIGYTQTLYYRSTNKYYTVIPSGQVVSENAFTASGTKAAYDSDTGKYVELGYVYTLYITNYQGKYSTWFVINNIGHLFSGYETKTDSEKTAFKNSTTAKKSNTQQDLSEYITKNKDELSNKSGANNLKTASVETTSGQTTSTNVFDTSLIGKEFISECYYCNQKEITIGNCKSSTPPSSGKCPTPIKETPEFIYRTVTTTNINPNDRALGPNWTDAKGASAKEQIEALGSNFIASTIESNYKNLNSIENNNKVTTLDKSTNSVSKKELTANTSTNDIYDDSTKEYLEYEFNLTPSLMQEIKKNNKNVNYTDMNFDQTASNVDAEGYYTCNKGKECISSFVTYYAEKSNTTELLNQTRTSKWKYYVNGEWKKSSISEIFGNAGYPDPVDNKEYLKENGNWP